LNLELQNTILNFNQVELWGFMDLRSRYIALSTEHDPLRPFENGFRASLEWIDRMDKASDKESTLIFRTRSPLVILLTPGFRKIQSRLKIIVPVEALNDALHWKLDPESKLPRPSERIQAAQSLHKLGFDVDLELRPYLGQETNLPELPNRFLQSFANICDISASRVLLRESLTTSSHKKSELYLRSILQRNLKCAELVYEEELDQRAA
jgi:DNA repair photolyase